MEWNNVSEMTPNEGEEVIVYTDDDKMRICLYSRGRFSTYLKVTHWSKKPNGPQKEAMPEKRRGRPKNGGK